VLKGFFKVPYGHIQVLPGHFKRPQATSKWHAPLIDSGCCHEKR